MKLSTVPSKINTAIVNTLAKGFNAAIDAAATTGEAVTNFVTEAEKFYGGEAIPDSDAQAVWSQISAAHPKWQEGTQKSRKTEVMCVLTSYAKLNKATKAFRAKSQSFSYHHAVGLARHLKTLSVTDAVDKMLNGGQAAEPASPKEAKKRAAIAIKRVLKLPKLPSDFKAELRAVCGKFEVNVSGA